MKATKAVHKTRKIFNIFYINFTNSQKRLHPIIQKRRKYPSHTGETQGLYSIDGSCVENVWVEEKGMVLFLESMKTSHAFI